MNLKCLIELLIEKSYIKYTKYFKFNNDNIAFQCNYEYQEIGNKIEEHILKMKEKGKLNDIEYEKGKRWFIIVNKRKLKNLILNLTDTEKRRFISSDFNYICINLDKLFKNDNDLEIENKYPDGDGYCYYITNLKEKRREKERKRKEKEECLNFLNSLP